LGGGERKHEFSDIYGYIYILRITNINMLRESGRKIAIFFRNS